MVYDANGNLTNSHKDDGCDGTLEYCETRTYDANGNETSAQV